MLKPHPKRIQSKDNPFFKSLLKKERGTALLEGDHLVHSWWERYGQGGLLLLAASQEALYQTDMSKAEEVWIVDDRLMKQLTSMPTPPGVMLKIPVPTPVLPDRYTESLMLLDGVQDPGNVGTLLRTAAASGIRHVLLSRDCAAPWSPKVLRSAQGAHFALEIALINDVADWIGAFKAQNGEQSVIGTVLDPTASSLYACDLTAPCLWIFGNEGQGIRPETQAQLSKRVYIPQAPGVESLNVAMAAAICLFEQRRQQHHVG